MRPSFYIISLTILAMIGFRTIGQEKLVPEDGTIAAQSLPLDKETSKVDYQTATFGIG